VASEHAPPLHAAAAADVSIDVSQEESVQKLRSGAAGLPGVLFLAITGSAPLAVVFFNFPVAVGFGEERSSPSGFIYATVMYGLFAVGYIAMARKLTATGGFYAFISHGLGRVLALAAGFAMMASYSLFASELMGGAAGFAKAKFDAVGANTAWIVWALAGTVLISVFAYFDIRLSVKVLAVALLTEITLITIFTVAVFAQGGNGGVSAAPINPVHIFTGIAPGIGIFFAIISWVGTETVVNYGEESRNPRRIVPLGTMIAMIGVGVFYTLACWAFVLSYGPHNEAFKAISGGTTTVFGGHKEAITLANAVTVPNSYFTAHWLSQVMSILIISSSLACGMALNNVCVRYFYALGREGILPAAFGRIHPKHRTPHIAVATQAVMIAAVLVAFWATNVSPFEVYAWLGIPALAWLMATQAVCSIATIVYFYRHRETNVVTTVAAPLLAFAGLTYALYLLFSKLSFVAGGTGNFVSSLPWITLAVPLIGIAYAVWLRSERPDAYVKLGRMVNKGEVL
jgi:amino acid transporter